MKLSSYLSICLFFCITFSHAQEKLAPNKPAGNKKLPLFFEKVYVHTDRNYYSSGEDIWFKAYLVNAISNVLIETSRVLYVELRSKDTSYVNQIKINITNGVGNGDFQLPDSVPSGTYTLRAFSNWMLNFGDLFLFKKELKIINTQKTNPQQHITSNKKPTIGFYPEGGSAITEAMNNMAFKAVDENGKSCDANGIILSSDNDTLCWFNTIHNGMGTFAYMPFAGKKYFAIGTINKGYSFKTELPEPLLKGYGMRVVDFDTAFFYASIYTNQTTLDEHPNEIIIINALSHYKNAFTGQIIINDLTTNIKIPKKNFFKGITCITAYDTLLRAHCQRLFNITKNNQVLISLLPNKQIYKPHEKVTLTLKVANNQGLPLKTNLSLSAIDSTQVPAGNTNIASYLLLESEVKGYIENPKQYFDLSNSSRNKQLDLLLLTQGWRDFVWRRVKDTTLTIKCMVEMGIAFSGRVRQKFADNPLPGMNISAYIPGMSGAVLKKTFSTTTNEKGQFYFDGLEFYGRQNAIVTSRDQKGKKTGWLLLDTLNFPKFFTPALTSETDTTFITSNFAKESAIRRNTLRKYTLSDTIELSEVVVTASKKKNEKQRTMHIVEAGYPDYEYSLDENDHSFTDLGSFMMQKVPGARFPTTVNSGDPFNRVMFNVMGDIEPPRFIVDGHSYKKDDINDENYIYNIPVSDIETIMVSKTDIQSGGKGIVISIFTSPYSGAKKEFYTVKTKLEGYYQARVFYSPVYPENYQPSGKPDLRPTIFWNPSLETNEKGECTTSFYNSDKKTTIRISAEGITEEGTPVVVTGSYDVK